HRAESESWRIIHGPGRGTAGCPAGRPHTAIEVFILLSGELNISQPDGVLTCAAASVLYEFATESMGTIREAAEFNGLPALRTVACARKDGTAKAAPAFGCHQGQGIIQSGSLDTAEAHVQDIGAAPGWDAGGIDSSRIIKCGGHVGRRHGTIKDGDGKQ